jgi:hypothetical protein
MPDGWILVVVGLPTGCVLLTGFAGDWAVRRVRRGAAGRWWLGLLTNAAIWAAGLALFFGLGVLVFGPWDSILRSLAFGLGAGAVTGLTFGLLDLPGGPEDSPPERRGPPCPGG